MKTGVVLATIAGAALFAIPVVAGGNNFIIALSFIFATYTTLALSWNIVGGFAGQLNLGHAAFFGVAAYTLALSTNAGMHPYVGVLAGGIAAIGMALLMSPLLKLRGDYFAIGTLSLTEAIKVAILNVHAYGIRLTPYQGLSRVQNYYFLATLLITVCVATFLIERSRIKLAFVSIRENEALASGSGVNLVKYKVLALVLSGFFTGLVGGIYGYNLLYVPAEHVFSIEWTIIPLFMVLIGGRGTLTGPLIGAVIYLGIYYVLQFTVTEISLVVFGLVVVLIIKFMPQGLIETLVVKKLGVRRTSIV
ncbi:MAG: branched-chain amino acid ABC transporter permease [Candidatus Caldarchaeum sp.]|uniref:Branched-chain amino acid ABC transporter permease n=1 Tax=Caldiarchaeum subterraneum TaxID=311458 RepID=A0A7C5L6U5_CALS0